MSSDITLYTWATPSGIRASITLEELDLPYETRPMDIMTNIQKEEWFLKINPNGRVPAITYGSQRVFESGSIMLYLTDKYDTERKISHAPGQANHFRLFTNVRSDYGTKRYIDETRRLYSVLESRLKESPYLAGSKYTIAHISNFTWARNGPSVLDIDFSEFPALKKWVNEIEQRAAVQKGADVPHTGRSDADRDVFIKSMLARIAGMTNTDKH